MIFICSIVRDRSLSNSWPWAFFITDRKIYLQIYIFDNYSYSYFSMLWQKSWFPALKNKFGVLVFLNLLGKYIPPFIYYYFWRTTVRKVLKKYYRKVLQIYTLVNQTILKHKTLKSKLFELLCYSVKWNRKLF